MDFSGAAFTHKRTNSNCSANTHSFWQLRSNQVVQHGQLFYPFFSCSMVSLVGSGFFSCVSVFFSLVLSKELTSARSGLSPMAAGYAGPKKERA